MSQRPVLGALAFAETREAFALDQRLEVRGLLMSLVGCGVVEHFIEQEVRGILERAMDLEELRAGLLPGLRGEACEDVSDGVGLAVAGFPEGGDCETAGELVGLHGGDPPADGNGEDVGELHARISGEWFGVGRRVWGGGLHGIVPRLEFRFRLMSGRPVSHGGPGQREAALIMACSPSRSDVNDAGAT